MTKNVNLLQIILLHFCLYFNKFYNMWYNYSLLLSDHVYFGCCIAPNKQVQVVFLLIFCLFVDFCAQWLLMLFCVWYGVFSVCFVLLWLFSCVFLFCFVLNFDMIIKGNTLTKSYLLCIVWYEWLQWNFYVQFRRVM